MPSSIDTTATDVANGVKALQVAVDALGMIAALGGVQGDWALDALREVKATMFSPPEPRNPLKLVEDLDTRIAVEQVCDRELSLVGPMGRIGAGFTGGLVS